MRRYENILNSMANYLYILYLTSCSRYFTRLGFCSSGNIIEFFKLVHFFQSQFIMNKRTNTKKNKQIIHLYNISIDMTLAVCLIFRVCSNKTLIRIKMFIVLKIYVITIQLHTSRSS